jgi:hypothetical protein
MIIYFSILTIAAIIVAPFLAVYASEWLNERKETQKRKLEILRDLMATRGTGLSPKHVEALNKIDIEFYDVNEVTQAWRIYRDHLTQAQQIKTEDEEGWKIWVSKKEDLLTELLNKMAIYLKYKFDVVQIKRGHYYPQAFANIETEQQIIRRGLVEVFVNKRPFPIFAWITQAPPPAKDNQLEDKKD